MRGLGSGGEGDSESARAFPFPLSLFLVGGGRDDISMISISGELSLLRLVPLVIPVAVGEARAVVVVVDVADLLPLTFGSTLTSLMIFWRLALVTGLAGVRQEDGGDEVEGGVMRLLSED